MLPDRVSNPGPLTYESGALPIALRGPAKIEGNREKANNNTERYFKANRDREELDIDV